MEPNPAGRVGHVRSVRPPAFDPLDPIELLDCDRERKTHLYALRARLLAEEAIEEAFLATQRAASAQTEEVQAIQDEDEEDEEC